MYVEIGGIRQWVEIELEHPDNPVLLLLHGGPAGSTRFASASWRPWRRHFTLVHWDQRGAGRTFGKNGAEGSGPMRFDRFVADGIEVAEFVRRELGNPPVFLLGHSWGSAIGVHMVKRRPDLFAAFVGTGQLVSFALNEAANYERELAQAREAGNAEALGELTEIGPPPHDDLARTRVLRKWSDVLASGSGDSPTPRLTARPDNLTDEDMTAMADGFAFSGPALFGEIHAINLPTLGTDFAVPMFCFMGTHDQQTPIAVAEDYFRTITAPRKAFVRFEGCHHFVHMNRPDAFLEALVTHLLPLAGAAPGIPNATVPG
ncbi:MAG: alpha/beta hydrolase [Novosphingobium sp.]|nr:alpha/beta hydrolase [Novosphingobium sp.]